MRVCTGVYACMMLFWCVYTCIYLHEILLTEFEGLGGLCVCVVGASVFYGKCYIFVCGNLFKLNTPKDFPNVKMTINISILLDVYRKGARV